MSKDPGRTRSGLPVSLDEYRLLDTAQMAEATGYCVAQILRLTKAGKFPKPRRIGRRYLWPASALIEIAEGPRFTEDAEVSVAAAQEAQN